MNSNRDETTFRIQAGRDGLRLDVDEQFWNDEIVSPKDGTTALDINIATAVQEIRAALYFVGTERRTH